jgi:TetR/AcrR family transcriptional regulator, repressor of fatR-cypB operon
MAETRRRAGRPPATLGKRDVILDAALRCFVERGFHGTSMPDIAERAGIAAGTIYHYFPSKEALVNTLFRTWKAEIAQRVFAAFPQHAPPREQFAIMWRTMADFALEHRDAFAFLELHHHTTYLDGESIAVDRNLKDFAHGIVRRAQADGLLKPVDPNLLMELVFGAFNGMMAAVYDSRIHLTPAAIAASDEACWDMVSV